MAELTLAILPLVGASLKLYGDIARLIRRLKNFESRFIEFHARIGAQRIVFRNEMRLLLAQAVGYPLAVAMFNDSGHQKWQDNSVEKDLTEHLGDSADAVKLTVEAIKSLLETMESESERVANKIICITEKKGFDLRTSASAFFEKVHFLLGESRLVEQIADLRQLNLTLQTLSSQAKNCEIWIKNGSSKGEENEEPIENQATECVEPIQETSALLYDVLGECCNKHIRHDAHFRLNPKIETGDRLRIEFEIGFKQSSHMRSISQRKALWFSVESSYANKLSLSQPEPSKHWRNLSNLLSQSSVSMTQTLPSSARVSKRSRSHLQSNDANEQKRTKSAKTTQTRCQPASVPATLTLSSSNFLESLDLCTKIKAQSQNVVHTSSTCIGCLKNGSSDPLLVYVTAQPLVQDSISLFDILTTCKAQRHLNRLSHIERARFAKILALAVPRFSGTRWLKQDVWKSKNLMLYHSQPSSGIGRLKLTDPYIDVTICSHSEDVEQDFFHTDRPWLTSPVLFGLTIMLIEIAFEQPLHELTHATDIRELSWPNTELATVKRTLHVVAGEMGEKYRNVVENCFQFSISGANFNDDKFRRRYHKEVVTELQQLEKLFAGIDLGK